MKKYITLFLATVLLTAMVSVPISASAVTVLEGRTEIAAKEYSSKHAELTLDGGIYAAFNNSDVWLEYTVYSQNGGDYYLYLLAGLVRNSDVSVLVNGEDLYTRTLGLTTSASIRKEILLEKITLSAGNNTLKILNISDKMYLEKLILEDNPPTVNQEGDTVIPGYSYTSCYEGLLFEKGYVILNSESKWVEYTILAEKSGIYEFYISAGTVFSVTEVYLVIGGTQSEQTVLTATSAYDDLQQQYIQNVALHQGLNTIRICHNKAGLYMGDIVLKPYITETVCDIPENGEISINGVVCSETSGVADGTKLLLDENESVLYNVKAPFDGTVRLSITFSETESVAELCLNYTQYITLTADENGRVTKIIEMLEGNNSIMLTAVSGSVTIENIEFYTKGHTVSGEETKILSYDYNNSSDSIAKESHHLSIQRNQWAEYYINVETAGTYLLYIGVATIYNTDTDMEIVVNSLQNLTAVLEATNNTYFTADRFAAYVTLSKGFNTLKITNLSGGIYFDYFILSSKDKLIEDISQIEAEDCLYGYNPVDSELIQGIALSPSYWLKYNIAVPKAGYYRIALEAISDCDTTVYVSQDGRLAGVIPIRKTADGAAVSHFGFIDLKEGNSTLKLILSKGNLELDYFTLLVTENKEKEFTESIECAKSIGEAEEVLEEFADFIGFSVSEAISELLYKAPVYMSVAGKRFDSASGVINELLKSIELEKALPSVYLLKGEEKTNTLLGGADYLVIHGSRLNNKKTLVCAVYQENKLSFLYTDSNYAERTIEVSLKESGIDFSKDAEFKLMEFDSFDGLHPINPSEETRLDLYVSVSGDDSQDGSKVAPFKTLARAKEKVAEMSADTYGDIVINLEPGTHFISQTEMFNEAHSGKNGYELIIRGTDTENPSKISGGVLVTDWEAAENGIWKAPFAHSGGIRNLYINNQPAVRAKSADMTVKEIYDNELTETEYDGVISDSEELSLLSKPENCEMVVNIHWAQHRIPVNGVAAVGEDTVLCLAEEAFGISAQMNGYTQITTGTEFYLENDLSLLDEENEFYYDESTQYIYYMPAEEMDFSSAEVIVPVTESLIKIEGGEKKAENITFENLVFCHSAFSDVTESGLINRQADYFYKNESGETVSYKMPGQITVKNSEGIQFKNCIFTCLGSAAIDIYDGVSNVLIEGNVFKNLAGGGILVGSIEPAKAGTSEGICTDISISNNVFRDIGYEYFCQTAVSVYYANTVSIKHNDLLNMPYLGISVGWGWGTEDVRLCGGIEVSNNRIVSVMEKLYDGSHIYTLGPLRDTVIKGNYMEKNTCSQFGGIYVDQGSGYMHISDNVIMDCQNWFFTGLNRTHDLSVYDNYSDSSSYIKRGEDNYYEDAVDISGGWTEEATAIYEESGLEDEFKELLNY